MCIRFFRKLRNKFHQSSSLVHAWCLILLGGFLIWTYLEVGNRIIRRNLELNKNRVINFTTWVFLNFPRISQVEFSEPTSLGFSKIVFSVGKCPKKTPTKKKIHCFNNCFHSIYSEFENIIPFSYFFLNFFLRKISRKFSSVYLASHFIDFFFLLLIFWTWKLKKMPWVNLPNQRKMEKFWNIN